MSKAKTVSEDEDFEELMNDEVEEDEMEQLEGEDVPVPQVPRKLTPEMAKRARLQQKQAQKQADDDDVIPHVPQVKKLQSPQGTTRQVSPVQQTKVPTFVGVRQPERIVVAYGETGEVIAEDMPLWAAQMWADLKTEIDELKKAIGKM